MGEIVECEIKHGSSIKSVNLKKTYPCNAFVDTVHPHLGRKKMNSSNPFLVLIAELSIFFTSIKKHN